MQSDFVARVKITKIYSNEGDDSFYKADILIRELYKGEKRTSIYIEGSSFPDEQRGSCGVLYPVNIEIIIYAEKKLKRSYILDFCSGTAVFTGKDEHEQQEIAMLDKLKEHRIDYTSKIQFAKINGFKKELKQFEGIQIKKTYALFEVTFDREMVLKSVHLISGLSEKIDVKLIEIIKNSEWESSVRSGKSNREIRNKVPDNSKLLIGFFFYPTEKGYQSFVGEYDL